ncbi:hypothetical protein SLEP1_g29562 [Rubroshorea leprosula]|uniref:Gnk2-homologous domain-containing protein n=1 Tax=Rubroshorea leprosula TaxID=152421 RepID=A0AAV5K3T4_9ROSI|nr:hypothetical protein SLEP1_g29562 [Rubroshorea leprosula]
MEFHYRVLLLLLLLLLLCVLTFMNFDIAESANCYSTGNFTVNGMYGRDRDLAPSSLASNTSENGGFYNTTVGKDPNKISSPTVQTKKKQFQWKTERYTMQTVASSEILSYLRKFQFTNTDDLTVNLAQFDQIWERLMDGLVRNASAVTSRLKFATGETKLTKFQTNFALIQCTSDLSQWDCDFGLRQSILQKTGKLLHTVIIVVVVSTTGFMAILAITCSLLRKRWKSKQEVKGVDESISAESMRFDFGTIRVATDNFSNQNKLR